MLTIFRRRAVPSPDSDPRVSASPSVAPVGTGAEHYDAYYYEHDCGHDYDWRSEHWRGFFDVMAARLVALFHPTSSLDAGCAKGILVGSLVEQGVDAHGVDISPTAVAVGDPRAAGRLRVGSLTEALGGRYDMVTCIEVVEHLSQPDAEKAMDHICAITDLVVLSSSPWDFKEATHVNVRPGGHWAAMMFDRGFVRRFDVDLSFITPWAAAYERRAVAPRAVVDGYESALVWLRSEVGDKRQALLEAQAQLAKEQGASAREQELTLALLASRDRARGSEAVAGTASRRVDQLQGELHDARAVIDVMRASLSWKVGRVLTAPVRWVRGVLRLFR